MTGSSDLFHKTRAAVHGKAIFQRISKAARINLFFSASLAAAILTSCFNLPRWEYIDFKVILCLFELMVMVKAFEEYGVLQRIAVEISNRCQNERFLTQALCGISFLLAMFVTNDVAILTIVPILIVITRQSDYSVIFPCILVTMAANLGSSMTPIGNPQNLFIFSFYHLNLQAFFSFSVSMGVLSLVLLAGLSFLIKPRPIALMMEEVKVKNKSQVGIFALLSVLAVLSVVNLLSYWITFPLIVAAVFILNRSLLKKVNYLLLLTFVCIFIAVGNLSHITLLESFLTQAIHSPSATYLAALLLSQIISNVPSTVMLAPFTINVPALFYGVNIGGLGTPVASLASIIAITLFNRAYPQKSREFLTKFLALNLGGLIVLGLIFTLLIWQ